MKYMTIAAFYKEKSKNPPSQITQKLGHDCIEKCREQGIIIKKINIGQYSKKNMYPKKIITEVLEEWGHQNENQ